MASVWRVLIFLLACTGLAASAFCQDRVLRPGDRVRLVVEEEPSLNRDYTVTRDGMLVLSFIGAVEVGGRTPAEASRRIADRLVEERILVNATVRLTWVEQTMSAPIRFSGAVKLSGEMPWREGLRLADVLKLAEPTLAADLKRIEIKPVVGAPLVVDFSRFDGKEEAFNPTVRPGDEIRVPIAVAPEEVFVLGGVIRPGAIPLSAGMTVRRAIAAAGGFGPSGDASRVRIERGGVALVTLDLTRLARWSEQAERLPIEVDPPLLAGDRVVVSIRDRIRFVVVEGEVGKAGTVAYDEGMTISQAIQKAGGATARARLDRVQISRLVSNRPVRTTVNMERVARGFSGDVQLLEGDTVIVPAAPRSRSRGFLEGVAGAILLIFLIGR
jgi:protein involved in polysaccharide export with SLBB domain